MHYDNNGQDCYTYGVLPGFQRGAFWLFVIVLSGSLLLSDQPWATELILVPEQWKYQGQLWTPLSAPFLVNYAPLTSIFTTLAVQWFLGSRLEIFWGTKKYLIMVLTCAWLGEAFAVLCSVVFPSLTNIAFAGALPINAATTFAFGVTFSRQLFQPIASSTVDGRTLSAIVGSMLLGASWLNTGTPWPFIPALGAVLVAILFVLQPWHNIRNKGKRTMGRSSHLRVVKKANDLLN